MNEELSTRMTITKLALSDHVETWIEAFLVDRKAQNLSPYTVLFYRDMLRRFIEFSETQAITQVGQINPDVLRRYMLYLDAHGHNAGGVAACYRALKAFIRWYWTETDQAGNPPTAKVKAPKVSLEPLTPVELPDVEKLIKTCKGDALDMRDKALFLALLDTGARASELMAINLDDIDLVSGSVLIRSGKGRKPRTVFLSQVSRRAIRAYLKTRTDDNTALWINETGGRLSYGGLRGMLERRSKQAGIQDVTLHAFRRAFAINMLRAGVDVFSLQTLLGHADLQVLRRYLRQNTDDLRAAHAAGSPVDRLKTR